VPQRPADPARPDPPSTARWVPTGRAVGGLAAVVVVAVLVALVVVWQAQPAAQAAPRVRRELPSPTTSGRPAGGSTSPPPGAAAELVVHVVGAVHRPGLVRLPGGARVADALAAAGGATAAARLASVNLARPVVDGEQVVVQRRGRPALLGAPPAGGPAADAGPTAPVDLNTATLDLLDGLPGIGPVLAQRILDWRTAHGRFSSVDELGEVSGIGEAILSDLAPLVVV
jgi:competence protein ComEA